MKRTVAYAIGIVFTFYLVEAIALIADFARRPFPPAPTIEEYDPIPLLRVEHHLIARAKFPVIDIHAHPSWSGLPPETLVEILDEVGVRCVVDLNGGWGEGLKRAVERYGLKYPDRFLVFANLNYRRIASPDFGAEQAKLLEEAVSYGARGLKIWKDLGTTLCDDEGRPIPLDDARLQPIWQKAGELGIPVLIHTADPSAFWLPLDASNERYREIRLAKKFGWPWHIIGPDSPPKQELLRQRERMLERNPGTIFIAAHMGMVVEDLAYLGRLLDRYPNLYVDLSAVVCDLGRIPYTARDFFLRYQDRILFGSDVYPRADVYRDYFRFLETFDEYIDYPVRELGQGNWKIYGIGLPDSVLRKIYYTNAQRVLGIRIVD
ncbi:MAG: amidohydrolase [candidate division KSB1 bacterium]|nr:amidohydrolase [candidate division KSB1 bacterium]